MEKIFGGVTVRLLEGDITTQNVDAVVNAANSSLLGGGGVDGAIHRAGGPDILAECKGVVAKIGRLDTGKAVATTAGTMPAKHVIHTVGPVWYGGGQGEPELLADAYRNSLAVADELGAKSVAFPGISTGVYGYPVEQAARVARQVITGYAAGDPGVEEIRLVLFGDRDFASWKGVFDS